MLQTVPAGVITSAPQGWSAVPEQRSGGSQKSPEPARQTVIAGATTSDGQG
jgi:hypothetical protein